jgi:hypothetical protein
MAALGQKPTPAISARMSAMYTEQRRAGMAPAFWCARPGLICVRGAGLSSAALVGKRLLITSSARSTSTPVADSPGRDCERSVQSLLYLKNRPLLCVLMI